MALIRPGCRSLLFIIVLTIWALGCGAGAGISNGGNSGAGSGAGSGSGGGGNDGGTTPPVSYLWSGILDPSRAIDWSGAGVPGGIPNRTTQCGPAIEVSGDTFGAQDVTNVNSAIQNCYTQPNTVVQLGTGTFYNCGGFTFGSPQNTNGYTKIVNNVTLRGTGPMSTIVKVICPGQQEKKGYANAVGMSGNIAYAPATTYPVSHGWTAGYAKGSTLLTLDSVSGLATGMIVILDQRNSSIGLTGCESSGTTATCTTSINHNFAVNPGGGGHTCPDNLNDCVFVGLVTGGGNCTSGIVTESCYNTGVNTTNGAAAITAVTSNTFSYKVDNAPSGNGSAGYADVDTGGVWVTNIKHATTDETSTGNGRSCPDSLNPQCQTNETSMRSQAEVKKITAVCTGNGIPVSGCQNATQIIIDSGLYHNNWASSQAPGIWTMDASPTSNYVQGDGIENMTIDGCNDGGSDTNSLVEFYRAYGSWVKNVRFVCGDRNAVWIRDGSAHIQVQDSYFVLGKGSASQSYGVETFGDIGDSLFANNIFQHIPGGLEFGGCFGCVAVHNYSADDGYYVTDTLLAMTDHGHDYDGYNLSEGNNLPTIHSSNVHGTMTGPITFFRNRGRGQTPGGPTKQTGLNAVDLAANNRGFNLIGNVLGTPNSTSVPGQSAYWGNLQSQGSLILFVDRTSENGTLVPTDPLVHQSMFCWGNWDVVTGSAQWAGAFSTGEGCFGNTTTPATEVPGAYTAINAQSVPTTHTLPASFFYTSQPSYWATTWGTPQWPPIGPDVTSGSAPDGVPSGMADSIPSQLCADNLPLDSSYLVLNTVTGASWSAGPPALMTLTGTFTSQWTDTFKMSGMLTSGSGSGNGNFQIYSSNGPITPYQPSVTVVGGTSNPAGNYQVQVTLRQSGGGETKPSPIFPVALTAGNGNFQITSPIINPTYNGTGATAAMTYGIYVSVPGSASLCLQAYIPLGSSYTQSTPVKTTPCTIPPTANTATATSITYTLNSDPGTYLSGGTIQSPLVLAYDAKSCYLN
jgi:hypothetical protein